VRGARVGDVLGMEFSAGDEMTYADEAMTGLTASSELVRLKVSRPRW
jgi:hypothetical protein